MIRSIACLVAAVSMIGVTSLSAELYNPAIPGVSVGAACDPCSATTFPVSNPSACQQCPLPGGFVMDGSCPTCPTTVMHNTCPTCPMPMMSNCPSCPTATCPTSNWCPSCMPGCSMTWCIKTKICCRDNPCQMPPHYQYQPACHGNYYFAPYNYSTALKQKAYTQHQNLDPRFPYATSVFEDVYADVVGDSEVESAAEETVQPAKHLPNLADILRKNQANN